MALDPDWNDDPPVNVRNFQVVWTVSHFYCFYSHTEFFYVCPLMGTIQIHQTQWMHMPS